MVLGSSNSAELRSQLLWPLVQSLGLLLHQQEVQTLDRQLPMVAVQPVYPPALEVLVPTRSPPRPVDEDRLLHLEWIGLHVDPNLWSRRVSARWSGKRVSSSAEWPGVCILQMCSV